MDIEKKKATKNPQIEANIISRFLFLWILPLFRKGSKQDLEVEDLYEILEEHRSENLGDLLARKWEDHLTGTKKLDTKPSLVSVLVNLFGRRFACQFIVLALNLWVFRVVQPICLQLLIRSFENEGRVTEQISYAVMLCVSAAGNIACLHHNVYALSLLGMQCRIACSSLIYRKMVKLSKSGEGGTTIGQLVNLLSNDVSRFDRDIFQLPFLLATPVQLIIFTYFLYKELGPSCFVGVSVFVLLIPVQFLNGKCAVYYRRKVARFTDERGKIMSEIITGIRVIKMYAWEKPYIAIVNRIRKLEVDKLRKRYYIFGVHTSIYSLAYKLFPFCIILTYALTGNRLTADKVFYTVVICNSITYSMGAFVQAIAVGSGELLITVKRIQDFLLLEERRIGINGQKPEDFERQNFPKVPLIKMNSICASWNNKELQNLALKDINLQCCGNKLVAVVGTVGSGKSALLNLLIGELEKISGVGFINGKISYASQEPWIFDGTVRQNIIFGNSFDKFRYDEVTKAVALQDDFKTFPYGDLSRVGERGITLSGGQKARVNLARAIYQKADIYLMDDPLSAVDVHVGRHLFEHCIKTLLKDSLRILVTHQLQFLPQVDNIVLIEKGQIIAEGSYADLETRGIDFIDILNDDFTSSVNAEVPHKMVVPDSEKRSEEKYNKKQMFHEEKMTAGSISAKTYKEYLLTGHTTFELLMLCVCFIVYQFVFSYSDYWLSFWTNAEQRNPASYIHKREHYTTPLQGIKTNNSTLLSMSQENSYMGQSYYVAIYSALVGITGILSLMRALGYTKYFMRISSNIHSKMLSNIIYSPVKFFDDNPSGRLMNRVIKDLGQVDEILPSTGFDTASVFMRMVGAVAVVIVSNYYMAIPSLLIFVVLWMLRKYYVKTARGVKRIEGISKSPIFSHITATFQGLSTIRAYGAEGKVIGEFDSLQDTHTSSWFIFLATTRCFCVWVESVSLLFVMLVTFSFLVITSSTMAGNIGLAISAALNVSTVIQFGMRQSAETENLMTSAERTLEYTKLKQEESIDTKDEKLPSDWPQHGSLEFRNVSLNYSDDPVLKNISFKVEPKEKLGIVGRTGAGKSSIVQVLFRMAKSEGEIFIDGISISDISLQTLRKSISIIPQDPVLFSGTIRYNLDPFEQFSDDELWNVIQEVELKSCVPALDFKVMQEGNNFSVGQKQLLCLARAILRKNKIIVMDEATANVDPRTDSLIQETIREKFSECTIITIAHRIHSVINGNKILVLDKGVIVETGKPEELLNDCQSFLFSIKEGSREGSKEKLDNL